MSQTPPEHPGPALLAREARVRHGPIRPHPDAAGHDWFMTIEDDCFWFKTGTGFHIFYRKGDGITVEREVGADPAEEPLWLNGSTYAAIAAINGYFPVHASAVAWRGRAYAFAGPSGSGKSTLAAALGHHGLPMVCDDTMILDTTGTDGAICFPGHKRLKLKADALSLAGSCPGEKVGRMIDKFYASPPGGTFAQALPLERIFYLDEGDAVSFEAISGARRIACLNEDHYTAQLYALARGQDRAGRLRQLGALASRIPMARLARPLDTQNFAATTAAIAAHIKQDPSP